MPALFPVVDLATILVFAVVFVLALTIKKWLGAVFQVVDKLVGWAPFVGGWIKAGENHVLSVLNAVVVASRAGMAACLDGLRWSLREFETGARDFADLMHDHWQQLVTVALPGAMSLLWSEVVSRLGGIDRRLDSLATTVAGIGPAIRAAADRTETRAVNLAADYADAIAAKAHDFTVSHVHGVYTELEGDIASARHSAEQYADAAIGELRKAEDAAIATAGAAAGAALDRAKADLAASIGSVSGALAEARRALDLEIAGVQGAAADALAKAETSIESELAQRAAAAAAALTATAASLAGQITTAEQAAEDAASSALNAEAHTLDVAISDASTAAAHALDTARTTIEGELAQRAADAASALSATRATVETEIGTAAATAAGALHATATALQGAIDSVTATAGAITAQLAAAEAAAVGELHDIYNLPADALRDLLDRIDLTKVAGFGAGLVLTRALVNAIAREAGLDSAECRAKNKEICGTPGEEWSGLLAGAAFVTGTLSLAELLPIGRAAFHELSSAIQAAT